MTIYCNNNRIGKTIHENVADKLQIHPKENNLITKTGVNSEQVFSEPTKLLRKSMRLPFAKQTEKIGAISYFIVLHQ